jgi:CRP-like cAMP-binding protein
MEANFESNFFTLLTFLDAAGRLEIDGACERLMAQPQEIIYSQGDAADSVYIVESGVVEALTQSDDGYQTRSVGFMARGDFFGDLAAFTGKPRLATVRACEATVLLKIEKLAFLNLVERIPKLGAYFSRNLARRLHNTSTKAHLSVFELDLTGNLRHFDLLTIFQAITSISGTGELQINNSANEMVGSFFFKNGRVEQARFIHLLGLEAVWQGFLQSTTDGSFNFMVIDKPISNFGDQPKIELAATDLLMQGATKRDVYQALPEVLRQMIGRIGRKAEALTWTEPETEPLAKQLWELTGKRPQPLASLWRRVNYSTLTFLEVVAQMIEAAQIELMPPAAPDAPSETQGLPNPTLPPQS